MTDGTQTTPELVNETEPSTAIATKNMDDYNRAAGTRPMPVEAPKKKRAPRGTKSVNPLAEAKAEVRLLQAKNEMLNEQIKNAFARERALIESVESMAVKVQNQSTKLALIERQMRNVVDTINLGGK